MYLTENWRFGWKEMPEKRRKWAGTYNNWENPHSLMILWWFFPVLTSINRHGSVYVSTRVCICPRTSKWVWASPGWCKSGPSRGERLTVGQNQVVLRHWIIHFPTSWGVSEQASKRVSERANEWSQQRASKASSAKQVNEWAVQGNKRTDKQAAQYLCPNSWLIWTTEQLPLVA